MVAVSAVALLAGGIVAWLVLDRGGTGDDGVVAGEVPAASTPAVAGDPAETSETARAEPPTGSSAPTSSSEGPGRVGDELPTPAELSTGPVLEWTEIDPGLDDAGNLMPLGDGRVLVRSTDYGDWTGAGTRLLATVNGVDWKEVPMPPGVAPLHYDLSGARWLVVGYEFPGEPGTIANAPWMASDEEGKEEEPEDEGDWAFPRPRVFFSDDRGAGWTELEINDSSDRLEASTPFELIGAALTSGDHMVIVLQSENPVPVSDDDAPGADGEWQGALDQNPLSRLFASDGGAFEQVAAYDGWVMGFPFAGTFSTPDGFSLGLVRDGYGRPQPSQLTSPDGRVWSENTSADFLLWYANAVGPDGSLWTAAWAENALNIQRVDRDGTRTTTATLSNLLPFGLVAGPSGLATMAATPIMLSGRVAKDGYELRANEPEGSITLWDLSADAAVYELGPETLTGGFPNGVREVEQPVDGQHQDAVVLVFENPDTGADLVSFTREELLSISFPFLSPAEGSPQPEAWVGWSADGVDWGWQTLADAFGAEADASGDPWVQLAVGDGFVLARVQQNDGSPPYSLSTRWFIARVP